MTNLAKCQNDYLICINFKLLHVIQMHTKQFNPLKLIIIA